MNDDRIAVDEPLISTDVDSLIRTIADRKKIQLDVLRRECRIDKKTLDKWIAVLEDEGYIDIQYGLGGTNILWRSASEIARSSADAQASRAPMSSIRPSKVIQEDDASAEIPSEDQESGTQEEQHGPNPEFITESPLEEETPDSEPEELLSKYLAKKRDGPEDMDSIKSSILTNMDDGPADTAPVSDPDDEPGPAEKPAFEPEDDEAPTLESEEDGPAEENEGLVFPAEKPEERMPTIRPARSRPPSADVRELMSSYLDEINKEKATIERLKKEKEELYRDRVSAMEGRMQADVVVLTEKIVEAQSRLADLKEHVLELPDKVDELDRLQKQMESLRTEGRGALERTRENAEEFISKLEDSRSEIEEKLSTAGLDLESYSGKIKELERLNSSLDSRSAKLQSTLDSARTQAEELDAAITALTSDVESVEKARSDVAQAMDSIKSGVAERGSELESLQQELEGIERMERWVQEYVRDYEHKIGEIESYVSKSGDEMADLKEAAESLYLKKYLGELECMTEAYQAELEDAVSEETTIERKIAESRDRITELVKESQEMIRKVREDAPEASEKDFGIMVAKAKAKTAMARRLVDEKQNERRNLVSESDETSRSARARPPKRKPLRKKAADKKKRK